MIRRSVSLRLTDDEVETLSALAFLAARPWHALVSEAVAGWLAEAEADPHVAAAKRAKRRHQARLRFRVVRDDEEGAGDG